MGTGAAIVAPLNVPVIVCTSGMVPVKVNVLPLARVKLNVMFDPLSVPDSAVIDAAMPIVPPAVSSSGPTASTAAWFLGRRAQSAPGRG